eukprot:scaffold209563_cov35-Prasinocladus_malaysianus.AAC.1
MAPAGRQPGGRPATSGNRQQAERGKRGPHRTIWGRCKIIAAVLTVTLVVEVLLSLPGPILTVSLGHEDSCGTPVEGELAAEGCGSKWDVHYWHPRLVAAQICKQDYYVSVHKMALDLDEDLT